MSLRASIFLSALAAAVFCTPGSQHAQAPVSPPPPAAQSPESPVARVDGAAVTVGEVEAALSTALAGRTVSSDLLPRLRAEVLAQLIDRLLVERAIGKSYRPTPEEVDKAVARFSQQAKDRGQSLEQILKERGTNARILRRQLAWQLGWDSYLRDRLDDATLKAFFEKHHREFDGTELRVRHILLRPQPGSKPEDNAKLLAQAASLRERIAAGKTTFEQAVRQFSAGPSRGAGGDLGYIPRRGVMVEPFARAAFALEKAELSPPVATSFGVHLIEVTDIRPGNRDWTEVRDALLPPASQAMFEQLAAAELKKAKIEFTGVMPHFEPGTREWVIAHPSTKEPAAAPK